MKKVIITKDFLKSLKCIKMNNGVIEYINDKNETIVLFSSSYLELNRLLNIDLEAKIINEEKYFISDEVVVPDTILYDFTGNVIGYKTVRIKGNKLSSIQNNMNKEDLKNYSDIYIKLENIVKKNNDLVFPNLCNCNDIVINENNDVSIVNYHGLQVGKYWSTNLSDILFESPCDYVVSKYLDKGLFTKNLDKKSLIMLYFYLTFDINLNNIGKINPITNKPFTLEEVFEMIGIDDIDLYNKVNKIFNDEEDNEYIGENVKKIEKENDLKIYATFGSLGIKKLIKKRNL